MKLLDMLLALCLPVCALAQVNVQAPVTDPSALMAPWEPGAEDCDAPGPHRTIEVHHLSADTQVFRQSPCVDYEANLLYLLIGDRSSLLIDTGAVDGEWADRTVVAVNSFLEDRGAGDRPLIVVHTHGHQDHRAGDSAFNELRRVKMAPVESAPLRAFLGIKDWPNDIAQIDLGNRIVDVIPTPGHHEDHAVFYDRKTRLLITGDFLLPGRLLVRDIDAYRASARRLAQFVRTHPVDHVLGAHIELDANGELYASGSTWHPNERVLPLSAEDVLTLPSALEDFNGFYSRHANYVVVNPVHNLLVLAGAVILALTLLVWMARRVWKRRRASMA